MLPKVTNTIMDHLILGVTLYNVRIRICLYQFEVEPTSVSKFSQKGNRTCWRLEGRFYFNYAPEQNPKSRKIDFHKVRVSI